MPRSQVRDQRSQYQTAQEIGRGVYRGGEADHLGRQRKLNPHVVDQGKIHHGNGELGQE